MYYTIEIKRIDQNIDEEIDIIINGIQITGFTGYCPYKIEIGKKYKASINLFFLDGLNMEIQRDNAEKNILKLDNDKYLIKGFLDSKGVLDVGFLIKNELFKDYEYFFGNYVKMKIDRFTISFR